MLTSDASMPNNAPSRQAESGFYTGSPGAPELVLTVNYETCITTGSLCLEGTASAVGTVQESSGGLASGGDPGANE